ncbi:MAG: ATP-binding protein [Deltaproteobacteria bacterium]|nr:ATP-binding protein [Deltaproteobacteria bacterium]
MQINLRTCYIDSMAHGNENPFWKDNKLDREITLKADQNSLYKLADFVAAHAWEAGFEDKRIEEIRLASQEALKNICEFAYNGKGGEITVECSVTDAGALIVTITDYGKPFNMLLADLTPDPQEKNERKNESVRLIKRLIKNVEYRRDAFRNIMIFVIPKPFI